MHGLLRAHQGSLTWVVTGEATPLAVELSRQGPAEQTYLDCPKHDDPSGFRIPARVRVTSGDGRIDSQDSFAVDLDVHGKVTYTPRVSFPLDHEDLAASGVGDPSVSDAASVRAQITLDPATLAPTGGLIEALGANAVELGRMTFGS